MGQRRLQIGSPPVPAGAMAFGEPGTFPQARGGISKGVQNPQAAAVMTIVSYVGGVLPVANFTGCAAICWRKRLTRS